MSDYRIIHDDELMHYGVPGMRWGHRKAQPVSDIRRRYDSAKAAYKTANRAYSKAHAQARNYDANPIVRSSRSNGFTNELRKKASDRKWDDALKKGKEAYKAEENYKQVKKERKNKIAETYQKINEGATRKERFIYNNATRKKAAKYVVDNNMSIADAKKKANKAAIRNTAILLGAYGAMTVYQLNK